jgi:hypothetical protein
MHKHPHVRIIVGLFIPRRSPDALFISFNNGRLLLSFVGQQAHGQQHASLQQSAPQQASDSLDRTGSSNIAFTS